jgi:preprotein translocase subunit SecY
MIKNISSLFKIKDFKFRFFNTIIFISVFRFGTFLVLPGVDSSMLKPYKDGILGILDTFLGGAFSNASIFGLGILPYISASIAVQLLTILFPKFQRIKMEGYSGRKKLNKLTKILTFGIAFFQSFPYLFSIISKGIVFVDTFYFLFYSTIFLVSGTMFCVWLGDRITDKGIGNGSSVLIAVGIVSSLPSAIYSEHLLLKDKKLSYYFIEFLALYLITAFIVGFTKAVRKINVVFAKNFELESYKYQKKQNISFKLNDTGIMPVIFAQTMMFIPAFITNTISSKNSFTSFLKKSFMIIILGSII